MKLLSLVPRSLIGVDIQNQHVNLIQVSKTRQGFVAEQGAIADLPADALVEGKIRDWDSVTQKVREIVSRLDLVGMSAAIILPATLVRMMQMQIPCGMSETSIEEEIHAQVEQDFPGMHGCLSIDFTVSEKKPSGYANVFFVAARQEYLLQYMDCINSTGLNVKIIDIDICAIIRSFSITSTLLKDSNDVSAIVYEHHRTVTFIVYNAYEIIFYQKWDLAHKLDFILQLINQLQIFMTTFSQRDICCLTIASDYLIQEIDVIELKRIGIREVFFHSLFAELLLSKRFIQQMESCSVASLFIACGAAMREVPRW